MANNIAIKLGIGIASAGAIGGAGYGVYAYNNTTDTVKNYLINNKFELRTDNWATVLETYKLEKTTDTTISPETADGIRDWCDTNLKINIDSTDNSLFKIASKWCVKFEIISSKFGTKTLEQNEGTLKGRLSKFENQEKIKLENVEGSETDKVGKQIKQWCATNSKRRYSDNNDSYYKDIINNCLTA